MKLPQLSRSCGDCKACCTALSIDELNKPSNTPCVHITEQGCGIYGHHPDTCKGFICCWLIGDLPEKYRPDQCGIIFWVGRTPAVQASLLREDVPIERVEYIASKLLPARQCEVNGKRLFYREMPMVISPCTIHSSQSLEGPEKIKQTKIKPNLFLVSQVGDDEKATTP